MSDDPYTLPPNLPVPEDDGAADHLTGLELPDLVLESSQGPVNVRDLDVLYVYPRTGRPGVPSLPGLGRDPRRARLHAAVVRLPRRARRAARARHARRRPLGAAARRPARVRGAQRDAVPGHRRSRPRARRGAAACRPSRSRGTCCTSGSRSSPRTAGSSRSSIPSSRPDENAGDVLGGCERDEARHVRRRQAWATSTARRSSCSTCRRCASGSSAAAPTRPASACRWRSARLRAPIVPKKFFHTAGNFREHEEESKTRRLVARDRAVDRLLPERRRDRRAGRAGRLSRAPDRGARLRARARGRPQEGRQVVPARGGDGLRRRLRDLQRHHRARHPAARDALRRLQLLQGDRHVLPARAVDRDAGRDPRPARPRDGAARERRVAADLALRPDERDDPGDPQPLLGARLLGRRRALDRDGVAASPGSPRTRRRST